MKNRKRLYALLSLMLVVILALALTGCGKTTNTPNGNQSQQDNTTIGDTTNSPEESESQQETTAPEAEVNPAQNSDGRYIYVIDGHELPLSVRLEDFIDGDVLDMKGLKNALGYTEGKIRDSEGNIIADTGASDRLQPLANLDFSINLSDKSRTMRYTIHGLPETGSQILTLTNFNPAKHISFNQLIAAVYVWSCYSDGGIHDDPLATILGDYRSDNINRIIYQIP